MNERRVIPLVSAQPRAASTEAQREQVAIAVDRPMRATPSKRWTKG